MSSYDNTDTRGKIFVAGLDRDCDEAVLEKTFTMFGDITQVLLIRDRETQESRQFGFITFRDDNSADDAIQRMNGVEIMGRCVTVKRATPSENRGRDGGGGGFRGRGRGGRGRGGYNNGGRDDRRNDYRGGYGDGGGNRGGGYNSRRSESPPRRNGYSGSRGYDDSRNGDRRGDYGGASRRYDDSRGRSRSPAPRYRDDRSPPPRNNYSDRRDYSPMKITRRVDHDRSPPPQSRGGDRYSRDDGGRRYGGGSIHREPSPGAPRGSRTRNMSPEYSSRGGRGGSPRSRPYAASPSPVRRDYSDSRVSRDYDSKDYNRSSGFDGDRQGGRSGGYQGRSEFIRSGGDDNRYDDRGGRSNMRRDVSPDARNNRRY